MIFRCSFLMVMAALATLACVPARADDPSAREFFRRLPPTIFENTPEGLSDGEKDELLENGKTGFWEITHETADALDMVALPFRESVVSVRLFHRGPGDSLAAVGTWGNPVCTIELWREDRDDRIVPVPTPSEPPVRDFFAAGNTPPKDVEPSVLICLGERGLEARIVFWNASGMAHVPVDNDVRYEWTQGTFEKRVTPRAKE